MKPPTKDQTKWITLEIDYNYRHYINKNWQIHGEALFEYFGSEVRDSPIARSDYEAEIGICFIYLFEAGKFSPLRTRRDDPHAIANSI